MSGFVSFIKTVPMAEQLKICSFNCHSFVTNVEIIVELLDLCDILLLQETFLIDDSVIGSHIGQKCSYSCTPVETRVNLDVLKGPTGNVAFISR